MTPLIGDAVFRVFYDFTSETQIWRRKKMRLLCELTRVFYEAFLHSVNLASNRHKKEYDGINATNM